jgi:malate dehydrogenase (quinone)
MATPIPSTNHPDVVLVGASIMNATLAVILKELDPKLKIELYEVLGSAAQESSDAWNNALVWCSPARTRCLPTGISLGK